MRLLFFILLSQLCSAQVGRITGLPGSDMSSALRTSINGSSQVIEIERSGGGEFRILGNLDFKGKTLKVSKGTYLSGVGTIQNAVIQGERQRLFNTTITLNNCRSFDGVFQAAWYGVNGNDNVIDDEGMQKALDYVIYNNVGLKILELVPGRYLTNGLLAWKDADGDGNPEFFNIEIRGSVGAYMGTGNEVVIESINPQTFALAIQKGKGIQTKNIYFKGVNQLNYPNTVALNPNTSYLKDASIRTNKFSPYAGLVIDPFGSSVTGADRYPGFEKYYAGIVGNGGSTDCKFYNLVFDGFLTNIILSPNGNTQNNEAHVFDGIWMSNSRDAFVTTNSQERTVQCRNFKIWNSVRTCFRTNGYGAERGAVPQIETVNVAGAYQLFDFWGQGGYFPVITINNFYAENFYWIGNIVGFSVQFNGFHFTLADMKGYGMKNQNFVAVGEQMTFENGILLCYNRAEKTPLNIYGRAVFRNSYLGNPLTHPTNNWTSDQYQVEYDGIRFYTQDGTASNGSFESSEGNYRYLTYGHQTELATFNKEYTSYKRPGFSQFRKVKSPLVRQTDLGYVDVVVSGNTATANLDLAPNTLIYAADLKLDNGFQQPTGYTVMRSLGNGKFDHVIEGMVSGRYSLYSLSVNRISTVGIIENGKVAYEGGIQSYATSEPNGIQCEYEYEEYGFSIYNPLEIAGDGVAFTKGSMYTNRGSGPVGWLCTKSGVKGSAITPEFKTIN